jgi:hypothetical protein
MTDSRMTDDYTEVFGAAPSEQHGRSASIHAQLRATALEVAQAQHSEYRTPSNGH